MTPSAPLVGRDEERAAVMAALEGGGCLIAGPAGIGKSRLAAEVAQARRGDGSVILRVVATASAASVPFGAFGHLLPVDAGPTAAPIPAFIRVLGATGGRGRPTLLVDDAHLLDDASAALVLAVTTTGAATVLATVRSHEPAPDAVVSLWKERRLDRIDLQPLSRAEVRDLVDAALAGPAHRLAHERIYELSQGNPLFVTELLHDARPGGALVEKDGRWHWEDGRLRFSRLRDLIDLHIDDVSGAARATLELLAVGAPLPLPHVEALSAPGAVEELERAGLVTTTGGSIAAGTGAAGVAPGTGAGGATVVDLAHPLYGELVAAQTPASVGRRLRRQLAEVLAREPDASEGQRLRIATWLLDAGEHDAEWFIPAAAVALRHGSPTLARRLAEAAGGGFDAALVRAKALVGLARFDDVEPVLAPLEAEAAAAPAGVASDYVETRFRALLRGTSGAPAAYAFLLRCEGWSTSRDWTALIATQRGWAALYDARPARAARHLRPYLTDPAVGADRRFQALALAVYALSRLGRVDDCVELDGPLREVAARLEDPPWEASLAPVLVDALARMDAARDLVAVAERLVRAEHEARTAGDPALVAVLLHLRGAMALIRGHAIESIRLLEDAVDGLVVADPLNAAGWALGLLAQARGLAGDPAGAAEALAGAEEVTRARPGLARRLQPDLERARTWVEVAEGRQSAARERLLALAASAGEDLQTDADARYTAIRLGADAGSLLARLQALASRAQSPAIDLYALHAAALARGDADAQVEVAERFEGLGVDLLAAEAATGAAVSLRAAGHRASSSRAAAIAARCRSRCQGATTPALAVVAEAPALTSREREIAALAARGLSNAEIAATLVLSVRTVETYVLRTCRKLGVANRHDLAQILTS